MAVKVVAVTEVERMVAAKAARLAEVVAGRAWLVVCGAEQLVAAVGEAGMEVVAAEDGSVVTMAVCREG